MSKKGKQRMTRQVRVFDDTADFIAELVRRKSADTTFADVVEDTFRKAYPEIYDRVIQAKSQARSIMDEALTDVKEK